MPNAFFDTSVLIAYFKEEDPHTVRIVEAVLYGEQQAAISAITVAEICTASEMNAPVLRAKRLAVINFLEIVTVDRALAERGGELRRQYNLALPDALIAACAEQAGGHFFTKDPHFNRLFAAGILTGSVYSNA